MTDLSEIIQKIEQNHIAVEIEEVFKSSTPQHPIGTTKVSKYEWDEDSEVYVGWHQLRGNEIVCPDFCEVFGRRKKCKTCPNYDSLIDMCSRDYEDLKSTIEMIETIQQYEKKGAFISVCEDGTSLWIKLPENNKR